MSRFWPLLSARWRRDVLQLTIWIAGAVLLAVSAVVGVRGAFPSETDRATLLATAVANPVVLLFRGLPSGTDEAAFAAFVILPFIALLAALMSTFLAVRHTRGDEDAGRAELIAATPAGRDIPLVATVTHGILANGVLGTLVTLVCLAVGFAGPGSGLMGLASALTGIAFLGLGLVAAQLAASARTANAIGVWAVLLSYLACGLGNALGTPSADLRRMTSAPLAWLSPFGWAENTRPYDSDAAGTLAPFAAAIVIALLLAFALSRARDLGDAFLPSRPGHATASAALSGPIGLVWREARGSLLGWTVGGAIVGVMSTRLASAISDVGDSIPSVQALLRSLASQGSLAQGAIEVFFTLAGVLAACAGIQTVLRARQDEVAGLAEPVRAAGVGPIRWVGAYLMVAVVAVLACLAAAAAGAAVGQLATDASQTDLILHAAVAAVGQAVAALTLVIGATIVVVIRPRLSLPAGWALVGIATVVGLFGPLFGFADTAVDVSPFASAPRLDGEAFDLRGGGWLLTVTVAGLAIALTAARRRELAPER
ncbi:polyketide antibiotic transporter [Microbacterium enclense]|uniref:ABC transporter permease n=1 Tax=Microbacterium enclense TaxID=993073 RepID=UPI0021A5DC9F|nr:polyketide antibiotic transporter [Microbacterium enclense]MCT2084536.1 polyketide antibiotic transporter [Microbacterium enclense]